MILVSRRSTDLCVFDSEDGKIKSGEAIFEGGVEFFLAVTAEGDLVLAERLTRKSMKMLPYWQQHPFAGLEGAGATEVEFGVAMAKL